VDSHSVSNFGTGQNNNKKKLKIYSFYYDRSGNIQSDIMPSEYSKSWKKEVLLQSFLPQLIVLIILIIH
jgi:hypothetical protein